MATAALLLALLALLALCFSVLEVIRLRVLVRELRADVAELSPILYGLAVWSHEHAALSARSRKALRERMPGIFPQLVKGDATDGDGHTERT